MSTRNQIDSLIQGYQRLDPRLYDILRMLASQIQSIKILINENVTPEEAATIDPTLRLPAGIDYELPGDHVSIYWSGSDSSNNLLTNVLAFELRKGFVWETADFILRTPSLSATIDPLTTGNHNYLLKTIGLNGSYSIDYLSLNVEISSISKTSLTANVIDNNVLLYWTEPENSPFNIVKYQVYREGESLGFQYGTFMTFFESTGGTFTYSVESYDLAGNKSVPARIQVKVNPPPDFEMINRFMSTLNGTKTHCVVEGSFLLAPTVGDTWQSHFATEGWTSIQDQLTAGYPLYIQPTWVP